MRLSFDARTLGWIGSSVDSMIAIMHVCSLAVGETVQRKPTTPGIDGSIFSMVRQGVVGSTAVQPKSGVNGPHGVEGSAGKVLVQKSSGKSGRPPFPSFLGRKIKRGFPP